MDYYSIDCYADGFNETSTFLDYIDLYKYFSFEADIVLARENDRISYEQRRSNPSGREDDYSIKEEGFTRISEPGPEDYIKDSYVPLTSIKYNRKVHLPPELEKILESNLPANL